MSLEDGLNAFKRGNHSEAIALLDAYCKSCEESNSVGSRNYMQAGMALVKAYHGERRFDEAIAQCEAFMENDANPALKIWADKAFPKLQDAKEAPEPAPEPEHPVNAPPPQSQEKTHLLDEGINAQKFGDNEAAIASLEEYLESCSNVRSRNYMQAQISRVKAYRALEQFDRAYDICEELNASDNAGLRSWAAKAMVALEPHRTKPAEPEDAPHVDGEPPAPVKKPTFVPRQAPTRPGVARLVDNTSTVELSAVPGTPTPFSSSQSSSASSDAANASTSGRSGRRSSGGSGGGASRAAGTGAAALMGGGALLVLSKLLFRRGGIAVIIFFIGVVRACFNGGGYVSDSGYYDDSYASDYTPGYVYDDLHRAACEGDPEVAETLIQKGADINLADAEGNTPLFWAVSGCSSADAVRPVTEGHQYIATALIRNGASVNTQNIYGATPLHWSAAWGNGEITTYLMTQGANATAVDSYDSTPLHWAAWSGNQPSTEVLVNLGVSLNVQNIDGDTPLDLANYYPENAAVAAFLQGKGAIAINTAP